MSHRSVEIVIGRLATDETLRAHFLAEPAVTLRELRDGGLDLNVAEVQALLEMAPGSWVEMASRVHPRLQKVALKGDRQEP